MKTKNAFKKILIAVIGVSSLVLFTGCRNFKDMTPAEKAEYVAEKAAWKLELRQEQETLLTDIAKEFFELSASKKQERAADRKILIDQVAADSIDAQVVMNLWNKKKDEIDQHLPRLIERVSEFHKTLDAEQKAEILEMLNKKHRRWSRH